MLFVQHLLTTLLEGSVPNLWTTITRAALDPTSSTPRGPSTGRLTTRTMLTYLGVAGMTGGAAAIVYALIRHNKISVGWIGRWWMNLSSGLGLVKREL
jgi:Ras family protein T1